MWKAAGILCAAVLVTACDRSPVAPSRATGAEPGAAGVLNAPDTGARATTREGDHVEPPGVLVRGNTSGRPVIAVTAPTAAR
jgi:hypothetical protein